MLHLAKLQISGKEFDAKFNTNITINFISMMYK